MANCVNYRELKFIILSNLMFLKQIKIVLSNTTKFRNLFQSISKYFYERQNSIG